MFRSGRKKTAELEDNLATLTQQDGGDVSDDDNAAPEMQSEVEDIAESQEDPLLLAIDDLEGRVVSALDDVKVHPGIRSSPQQSLPDELATLLRPVLEVAAHTAPSVARTYYRGAFTSEGIEASCEDVYQRVVSDLVLPVLLEMAQADTIPAKRGASLEFFRNLYKECHKPGSWLDPSVGANAGPYGSGQQGGNKHHHHQSHHQARAQLKRRQAKRLAREGEILRYWVQASIACTTPGIFTNETSEAAIAARGVIAASASLRPSLKHIAQRIRDADDRGANRIFGPVMKMVEGVLKKLLLQEASGDHAEDNALQAACIKFMEIVCLCCSGKPHDPSSQRRKSQTQSLDDFSLEDLPTGHPIITREALESIAEYAFACLRGLTLLGGQVKMDVNLLSDMMMGGDGNSPSSQVVSILKPAALGYLEIESTLPSLDDDEKCLDIAQSLDRDSLEFDFTLSPKSYALAINAIAALSMNRPVFFQEGAVCLARRAADPPIFSEDGGDAANALPRNAVLAIRAQLKASCLTLLRNALSVQTNSSDILHKCLSSDKCDMAVQADKALKMAQQTNALKTAGRAARNRAQMFYEWESTTTAGGGGGGGTEGGQQRTTKRQRETDDALAKMRAARASRGLGHGIQLPTSMVDSIELVMANLTHLPPKRPASAAASSSSSSKGHGPISLDFLVDAITTNGASLAQEEGRWYTRDGGTAWSVKTDGNFELSAKLLEAAIKPSGTTATGTNKDEDTEMADSTDDHKGKSSKGKKKTAKSQVDPQQMYKSQCQTAAAEAVGRIVLNGMRSRNPGLTEFAHDLAARLAWTLEGVPTSSHLQPAQDMALDTIQSSKKRLDDEESGAQKEAMAALDRLASHFPLVTSCLALEATSTVNYGIDGKESISLSNALLNEAYAQGFKPSSIDPDEQEGITDAWKYESSLDLFAGSILHSSERTNDKAADNDRKRVAAQMASSMQHELGVLPKLTQTSLTLISGMCDMEEISKKASEAARKQSNQTIAASAALHAAKQAAEKRSTAALLALRDAAFQRSQPEARKIAIDTVVAIAAGRRKASPGCEDKALKLAMNVLYARSPALAQEVTDAAITELQIASNYAIENFSKIQAANSEALAKEKTEERHAPKAAFAPDSDEEKIAMDRVRKPAILIMALCIRVPELIKTLFDLSSIPKADVLSKTVRQQMPKLARAAGTKHGSAEIALKVAEMATHNESALLLAFLDNMAPLGEKNMPPQEFIDACYKIQEMKKDGDNKDARFLIPVVSSMKRVDLVDKLPEFVDADDNIFLAALSKMSERLGRQALLFREEPEPETPTLKGLTSCEQLVYLHKLDFQQVGMPQKRYLDAIRICLDNEEMFNDRLIMSALDHMSGTFLTGDEKLPLAYMRTVILVCSKHESLHSWICHTLLPRLVEGKIYEDRRQWQGWMRCAKMLSNNPDSGVSSAAALEKLPPEQLEQYQERYGNSS